MAITTAVCVQTRRAVWLIEIFLFIRTLSHRLHFERHCGLSVRWFVWHKVHDSGGWGWIEFCSSQSTDFSALRGGLIFITKHLSLFFSTKIWRCDLFNQRTDLYELYSLANLIVALDLRICHVGCQTQRLVLVEGGEQQMTSRIGRALMSKPKFIVDLLSYLHLPCTPNSSAQIIWIIHNYPRWWRSVPVSLVSKQRN